MDPKNVRDIAERLSDVLWAGASSHAMYERHWLMPTTVVVAISMMAQTNGVILDTGKDALVSVAIDVIKELKELWGKSKPDQFNLDKEYLSWPA